MHRTEAISPKYLLCSLVSTVTSATCYLLVPEELLKTQGATATEGILPPGISRAVNHTGPGADTENNPGKLTFKRRVRLRTGKVSRSSGILDVARPL